MSDIEQTQDLQSFEQHLERIFKDLEDGVFITATEIADLRYACGLPKRNNHVNPVIQGIVNDFGKIFGENK